jgi:hypothetical protein
MEQAMTEPNNLRHWNALGKTDPKHTKQFSRAGGFKGTAIKPIWSIQRMTEHFGPVGIGWGMTKPDFQVVEADGEILVYCTIGIWYADDGKVTNGIYGVGGDKVSAKRKDGFFNNDEAFKAAYTDALSNAMKQVGVGADVHMGLFDDHKYVREMQEEFAETATPPKTNGTSHAPSPAAAATSSVKLPEGFFDRPSYEIPVAKITPAKWDGYYLAAAMACPNDDAFVKLEQDNARQLKIWSDSANPSVVESLRERIATRARELIPGLQP